MKIRQASHIHRYSRRGFTLIEIMLVIVIIGIIVGIAAPKLGGKLNKANDVKAAASIRAIEAAVHDYEMENLRLPDSLNDLTVQKDGKGPYLKPSELTDPWGQTYVYAKPGSHGIGFDLSCKNPDSGKEFNNWE